MKWTDYAQRGYYYSDYDQLSQWERLKYLIVRIRGARGIRMLGITLLAWPIRWRVWGIDQSQEYDSIELGPLSIWAAV